jgi:Zn-finger protein
MKRKNKACRHFPCHSELEDCTFCYCPFYPCENKERGNYINGTEGKIWDCSKCTWIHKKETVDKIFEVIRNTKII